MGRIITPRLWRTTLAGVRLEDITNELVSGTITMNLDRDSGKLSASFTMHGTTSITPYTSYLQPTMTVSYDDGQPSIEKPLGFFATRTPQTTRTLERLEAVYECEDLTRLLALSAYNTVDNVTAGTDLVTEIRATIEEAGITYHAIPASNETYHKDLSYPIGTTRLEKVNELLQIMGWYTLYPDVDGRLTSKPVVNLKRLEPRAIITAAELVRPVVTQINDQTVVNAVIVVKDDPVEAPIYSYLANTDPASPTSTVALGFEFSRVYKTTDVHTQAEADALAERLLQEAESYYQTATITTWPDVNYGLHEVVDLSLTGELATMTGRWWVRTWSLGMTPATAIYELGINRLTGFEV